MEKGYHGTAIIPEDKLKEFMELLKKSYGIYNFDWENKDLDLK